MNHMDAAPEDHPMEDDLASQVRQLWLIAYALAILLAVSLLLSLGCGGHRMTDLY